ncbi:uncharacterized protein C17orf50 homolog isoform X2 [Ascaphus truei]|uniref:uncharacterized protein C17orf50 homolog isoform X2 n=1 Tax=Ascaphus truei TaxID=8439 RepID=UPI003F5AC342
MSWQNKWSDRDTKEGSAGDKSIRNKRVQQLKKITSLALLCGSLKKHNLPLCSSVLRDIVIERGRSCQRKKGNHCGESDTRNPN